MSGNQSSRQSTALQAQNTRSATATNIQNTRSATVSNVQNNRDDCYNCGSDWDSGSAAAGFVAGAVVGGVVTAAATAPSSTVVVAAPAAAPPCNIAPVAVNGVAHYYCGTTWYAASYASNGVVYVPTASPPGY